MKTRTRREDQRPGDVERAPVRRGGLVAGGLALLLLLEAWPGPLPAVPAGLPAGLRLEARIEPKTATVGDPLDLELAVTAPQGYQALPPALSGRTGDFALLQSLPPAEDQPPGPGLTRRIFRYKLALYKPGDAELPPIEITIKPPKGEDLRVPTEKLKVSIKSVLTEKDPQLRGLKRQIEIEDPYRWLRWTLPGLALLGAGGLAWWLWRRRRSQPAPVPEPVRPVDPFVLAERELENLERERLPEKGRAKEHYVAMSEILRRILEAGYQISTLERTSEEILEELKQSGRFVHPVAEMHRLQVLMELCDMVKFAKYNPAKSENDAAFRAARQVLELSRRPAPAAAASVS